MYDKSLEQLIDAVIADGIITDQERKVVYKKAASLGIDKDEIEVYLNGRLDTIINANKPKSNKHGDVRLCPNCGAPIKSGTAKCIECGYIFHGTESNISTERLFKLLKGKDFEEQSHIIRAFPIPNTREDLFEFLSYLEGSAFRKNENEHSYTEKKFYNSCYTKYIECLDKARISFPDDKATLMFEKHLKNYSSNSKLKKVGKGCLYTIIAVIVIICILFII